MLAIEDDEQIKAAEDLDVTNFLRVAVSYGIAQEHSGHVSVESAPGRGTTFRITLPTTAARTRLQAAGG